MLQVKIMLRFKFFKIGWISISYVSKPGLFKNQAWETKEIENQPMKINLKSSLTCNMYTVLFVF